MAAAYRWNVRHVMVGSLVVVAIAASMGIYIYRDHASRVRKSAATPSTARVATTVPAKQAAPAAVEAVGQTAAPPKKEAKSRIVHPKSVPDATADRRVLDASCQNDLRSVQSLLAAGASADGSGFDSRTPLTCALEVDNLDMVSALLDAGANARREGGTVVQLRPVHAAALYHNLAAIELLVAHGAKIDEISVYGTPLTIAYVVQRRTQLDPQLAKELPPAFRLGKPRVALPDLLDRFVALGARLDAGDKDGDTILHYAAKLDDRATVAWLLDHDVDIDIQNAFGETAITPAASRVAFYIGEQRTGGAELLKFLIERGADVNVPDREGRTLLSRSTTLVDLQPLLISHGADPSVNASPSGALWGQFVQPLDVGRVERFASQFPALGPSRTRKGETADGPLHVFANARSPELVRYFLGRGLSATEPGWKGVTPLHAALSRPSKTDSDDAIEVMKLLLDSRADINARDETGATPLMYATRMPLRTVQFLIDHGADVNALTTKGWHVLDFYLQADNVEAMRLLREAGADSAVKDALTRKRRPTG